MIKHGGFGGPLCAEPCDIVNLCEEKGKDTVSEKGHDAERVTAIVSKLFR